MHFLSLFIFIFVSPSLCAPAPLAQDGGSLIEKGLDLISGVGGGSGESSTTEAPLANPSLNDTPPKTASASSGSSLLAEQGKEAIGVAGKAIGGKIGAYIGPKLGLCTCTLYSERDLMFCLNYHFRGSRCGWTC